MSGIVIIGAGECGVRAAFAARAEGFDGEVTLVGDECGMPYERPPLSKPDANGATLKPICTAEMLAAKNIMLLDGVAAKHINREASCVRLSTGEDLTYSRLLLATGASPRRLTCEGGEHAVTLRTIEDANWIYSQAVNGSRTVIIGAGLIGLELAAELVGRGNKVTILEAGPVPLGRNVPQPLAQRIVQRHIAEGVDILFNTEVARLSGRSVELVGGQTIAADLVVAQADADLSWTVAMIEAIRSARAQMNVPAGAFIPLVVKDMEPSAKAAWDQNEALIMRFARIESIAHVEDLPKGTVALAASGGTFGLPLEGVIDVAAEKARLEKTLGKLAKELGGLRGRLNNPKFAESAPAEVLEETRKNLALREAEEAKLKDAFARLAELG